MVAAGQLGRKSGERLLRLRASDGHGRAAARRRWAVPPAGRAPTTTARRRRGRPRARHAARRLPRAGCSRCRSRAGAQDAAGLVVARPPRRRCRSTACGSAGRCAGRAARFEVRVDTAFDDVIAACADPRRTGGWITADDRRRLHAAAPPRLGPQRRGLGRATARWPAASTAWPSAGCSPASRCSTGATDASKVALVGLVERLRERRADPARRAVGDPPPRHRSAPSSIPRPSTWRRLARAAARPLPRLGDRCRPSTGRATWTPR